MAWRIAPMVIILLLCVQSVTAHSPEDVDPAMAPWFRSLETPKFHGSCCSEHDCRVVMSSDVKIDSGTYWVRDMESPGWLKVFPERVLSRTDNPTGHYVACVMNHVVLCFVTIAGT